MRDGVFNMHRAEVKLGSLTEEFILYPVSDVHRETPLCDVDLWKDFLAQAKREMRTRQVFFVGVGDFNDFAAWGDRKRIRNAGLHESTVMELDASAKRHCDQMLKELEFTKGHWLGMVQGNHRWEWTYGELAGMSSDDYYARELGCRCLGDAAYLKINVGFAKTRKVSDIDVVLHHGKAGGKLAGTTINQVSDLMRVFPGADMYITGHDHRKAAMSLSTLWAGDAHKGNLKLKQKRQWLIRSGSFLRGYVDGESSYIVGKMLAPTDLGVVKIHCKVLRKSHTQNGVTDDRCVNDIHVEY